MKKGNLWLFNHDFEYQLAGREPVRVTGMQVMPWYFLNRNALILAPLLKSNDSILVYEKPDTILLEQYSKHSIIPPRLFKFTPEVESSSVTEDFQPILDGLAEKPCLKFWGLAQRALGFVPSGRFELAKKLSSKIFVADLRDIFLPNSWKIPSLALTDKTVTLQKLETIIKRQITKNGVCLIKHAFGVSGRLIDQVDKSGFSLHQLKRWQHRIKREGGVLVEKRLRIKQEWGLQLQFSPEGEIEIPVLTKLFSADNLSYRGTTIDQADQKVIPVLLEQLRSLLDHISFLGYRGPLGLDLIESEEGSFHLLEINARYTMGRIASAWHQQLGDYPCGYFTCFFYKSTDDLEVIIKLVRDIGLRVGVEPFVVNHVAHHRSNRSFITLYAGSASIRQEVEFIEKIREKLRIRWDQRQFKNR